MRRLLVRAVVLMAALVVLIGAPAVDAQHIECRWFYDCVGSCSWGQIWRDALIVTSLCCDTATITCWRSQAQWGCC